VGISANSKKAIDMNEQQPAQNGQDRIARWVSTFAVLALILSWALLHNRAILEPFSLTDPVGIFKALGGEKLITAVMDIVILFIFCSVPGWIIGATVATFISRSYRLTHVLLRFLRVGLWTPFFVWWPLPAQLVTMGRHYDSLFWTWSIGFAAIALFVCFNFLIAWSSLGLDRRAAKSLVASLTLHHALFVSLMLELSVWSLRWFVYPGAKEAIIGYAVFIFLAVFLIFMDQVLHFSFDRAAEARRIVLLTEISSRTWASLCGTMTIVTLFIVAWEVLSAFGYLLVAPSAVFQKIYHMASLKVDAQQWTGTSWQDIRVSLLEVFAGISLAGGAAFLVAKGLLASERFRRWMVPVLPLTYVVPIVLLPGWFGWSGLLFSRWTTVCVAFLTFFPLVQTLWGLRDRPLLCRLFLAVDEALPFAFVAVVYGESTNAVAGLGFAMVVASGTARVLEAVSALVLLLALFAGVSSTLRWLAKRLYFSDSTEQAVTAKGTD
jgi:ABC-type nitrate/sulfonate/bicarbonate transport system permease component